MTEGYSSIAVSVINHLNLPVAALGMTYRAEDQTAETKEYLVELLKKSAAELSKRLGSH